MTNTPRWLMVAALGALASCEPSDAAPHRPAEPLPVDPVDPPILDGGADAAPPPDGSFVATPQAGLEVEIASGFVHGTQEGALRVFRGIPFAEPPIGERRFRPPAPVERWEGTFPADAFGPNCPQDAAGLSAALGEEVGVTSEDCLSINVWAYDDGLVRPVMVFIYGGAFIVGGGSWPTYDPTTLVSRGDVVAVTFNYRLGALGFLATEALAAENDGAAGNYGIYDQLEALRWVRQNIAVFGGAADNVTIFGESAGAISVCALHGAPAADGLFDKAIIQSGMCTLPTLRGQGSLGMPALIESGEALAAEVGCGDAFNQLDCLRSKSADEMVALSNLTSVLTGDLESASATAPGVDGQLIVEQPLERIASGVVDKPLIAGSNRDEGVLFTSTDVVLTRWDLERHFADAVGEGPLVDELMELYPLWDFIDPKDAWVAFMGEATFICQGLSAVEAAASGQPSFAYHFTRTPLVTLAIGATHGLDIPYVFESFDSLGLIPTSADLELSAAMQHAWTSFARTGVPELAPAWSAYRPELPSIAILDADRSIVGGIRDGRCARLRELGVVD